MATTRTIWLPKPLPHQLPILLSPARYKAAACGRRWGKTAVGLLAVLRGHGPWRTFRRGAIDGGTIWWIAPTYGVAAKIWRDLKRACRDVWIEKNETQHRIVLPGGGSVEVKTAENPDNLRGEGLDGVVLDEAAFLAERVWSHSLRPSLSDKQGWAMFLSTPNGRNWFYELVRHATREQEGSGAETQCGMRSAECGMKEGLNMRRGEADEDSHGLVMQPATSSLPPGGPTSIPHLAFRIPHLLWQTWQLPSSQNPLIREAELAEAKSHLVPEAFAQEYEAQFTETEGAEFSGAYFDDAIWFDRWPAENEIRLRVMALDPSKGKDKSSDYSAFVMVAVDAEGMMWVKADLARLDVRRIIDRGLKLAHDFRPDVFGVEANQFQEVLCHVFRERLREKNVWLPLVAVHNGVSKQSRIRAQLTPHLARGEFRFHRGSPGTVLLVDQLKGFPTADHDDGPDALEMAVRLIKERMAEGEEEEIIERIVA